MSHLSRVCIESQLLLQTRAAMHGSVLRRCSGVWRFGFRALGTVSVGDSGAGSWNLARRFEKETFIYVGNTREQHPGEPGSDTTLYGR